MSFTTASLSTAIRTGAWFESSTKRRSGDSPASSFAMRTFLMPPLTSFSACQSRAQVMPMAPLSIWRSARSITRWFLKCGRSFADFLRKNSAMVWRFCSMASRSTSNAGVSSWATVRPVRLCSDSSACEGSPTVVPKLFSNACRHFNRGYVSLSIYFVLNERHHLFGDFQHALKILLGGGQWRFELVDVGAEAAELRDQSLVEPEFR